MPTVTVGEDSTIDELVLSKNATGTQVELEKKANVNTFHRQCQSRNHRPRQHRYSRNQHRRGSHRSKKPDKIVLEEGIKANVDGKDVSEPQKVHRVVDRPSHPKFP